MSDTVWWCAAHEASVCGCAADDHCFREESWLDGEKCRMVERRLVPVDALVLVRDADGNWPHRALFELALMISTETNPDAEVDTFPFYMEVAAKCLDEMTKRLAEAAKENPQPVD